MYIYLLVLLLVVIYRIAYSQQNILGYVDVIEVLTKLRETKQVHLWGIGK